MTTPAQNTNSYIQVPVSKIVVREDTGKTVLSDPNFTVTMVRSVRDFRPQSVNGSISNGWRYPTNWKRIHARYHIDNGSVSWRTQPSSGYPYWRRSTLSGLPFGGASSSRLPSWSTDNNLVNRAITAALLRLKSEGYSSDLNLGNVFGERHETLRTFTENAKRIADLYRAFRSRDPKAFTKIVRGDYGPGHWPSLWLEYQYGVRPLVGDISAAAERANKAAQISSPIVTVRGRASKRLYLPYEDRASDGPVWMVGRDIGKQTYLCQLSYIQDSPLEAALSSLGLTNPFAVAWELLPYSFVADWMFGIGDYISSWDAAFGWKFISGFLGEKVTATRSATPIMKLDKGDDGYASGKLTGTFVSYVRSAYKTSPLPRLPVIKDPVSYGHVANFASLVATALQRGARR